MWRKYQRILRWFAGEGRGSLVLLLVLLVLGLGCLYLAETLKANQNPRLAVVLQAFGTLFMGSVLVPLLFRICLWKELEHAIFERLGVKEAVAGSGLIDFWWFPDVPWKQLFAEAKHVRVFAISAATLLKGERVGILREFLRKKSASLTLVLQNPDDDATLETLDTRFSQPAGTRKRGTLEALDHLSRLLAEPGVKARVAVRVTSANHAYSCYLFDEQSLFVPYLVEAVRAPERIPALLFGKGTFTDRYLQADLDYLIGSGSREYRPGNEPPDSLSAGTPPQP